MSVGLFVAEFYHREQKEANRARAQKCSNCLLEGHHRSTCENEVVCLQCKKPGHRRGDPTCDLDGEVTDTTSLPDTRTDNTRKNTAAPGQEPEQEQDSDTGDETSDMDETNGELVPNSQNSQPGRADTRSQGRKEYPTRSRSHSRVNNRQVEQHTEQDKVDNNSSNNSLERDSAQPSIEMWLKEQRKTETKQSAKTVDRSFDRSLSNTGSFRMHSMRRGVDSGYARSTSDDLYPRQSLYTVGQRVEVPNDLRPISADVC
uniref:CCHC-type domain-containing protein n=1 Tax=Branchiostoma floridae TaxID=7739 RepID=C3ZX19_BRAFL|eukprot:XP_002586886.1 hypothetical protein BRAFLDRAFT_101983 [Branchiostoma floridae]